MRTLSPLFVLGMITVACGGAQPRDMSTAAVPITHATVVVNQHAVTEVDPSPRVLAILDEKDRLPEDRALDSKKQAADLLTFLDVTPGMRVAEVGCGGGYTTELLARAVGDTGTVYGENAPALLEDEKIRRAWDARVARPINARIVRIDRELRTPFPEEVRNLDLVYLAIDYQRAASLGGDAAEMNHAVHLALKSGGRYIVFARTPAEGERLTKLDALHAYESRGVRREIEAAGFTFVKEGRFFREGHEKSAWDATPNNSAGEKLDRFLLVFQRP